jgi:hypothetical protein
MEKNNNGGVVCFVNYKNTGACFLLLVSKRPLAFSSTNHLHPSFLIFFLPWILHPAVQPSKNKLFGVKKKGRTPISSNTSLSGTLGLVKVAFFFNLQTKDFNPCMT